MDTIVSEPVVVMPVKRKDGTYALRMCVNQGVLTPGMLKRVMDVMTKYELSALRATTGQRFNLEGIAEDQLDAVVGELGTSVKVCPPSVSVCPGGDVCRYGVQATRELGDKLLELVKENGPYPFKIKTGVSGCGMACGLSYVRDIGVVGTKKGWTLCYGGSAGRLAHLGVELGRELTSEEVLEIVARGLTFYKKNGVKRERIGIMVRRLGHEAIAAALI